MVAMHGIPNARHVTRIFKPRVRAVADNATGGALAMAEEKAPAEERKNLQVRVAPDYALRVAALARALGHASVADFIKKLLDDALANAQTSIDDLKQQVVNRYTAMAQAEIAALDGWAAGLESVNAAPAMLGDDADAPAGAQTTSGVDAKG